MIKNLLIKWANKIIDKYGIHYLNEHSVISMYDRLFKIQYIELQDNYSRTNKNGSYINIEGIDLNKYYNLNLQENQLTEFQKEYQCEWISDK